MAEAPPACNTLLIRYGEIALKSRSVRARFERQLVENLLDQLEVAGVPATVERRRGRILVHGDTLQDAIAPVSRTFGVVSFSPAVELESVARDDLLELAVGLTRPLLEAGGAGTSFAVRARRSGQHPFTSMELAGAAGAAILEAVPQARVNLKQPQVTLTLEVRENRAFGLVETLPGVGGMPLGSQGRVAALIDSPRSLLAAWMLAKRGCRCVCLTPPELDARTSQYLKAFQVWHPRLKTRELEPASEVPEVVLEKALWLAGKVKAKALVLGWGLTELGYLPSLPGMPLFLPLMGLQDEQVEAYGRTMLEGHAHATHPLAAAVGSGRRSRA